MIRYILTLLTLFAFVSTSHAAPRLAFTDIVDGPSTGIDDGLGSGVIVTVWGFDLGDSQGSSSITVGETQAAHIYYWKDADGSLPGGPSNLTNIGLQEVAFSIPSLSIGTHDIVITVDSEDSNPVPFLVRAGSILHIKTTGSDTADGSFSTPWATLSLNKDEVVAGDIIYIHDGVVEANADTSQDYTGVRLDTPGGSSILHTAVIAYPNSTVTYRGEESGIDSYEGSGHVWSKINVDIGYHIDPLDDVYNPALTDDRPQRAVRPTQEGRIIGLRITDSATTCTSGQQGAISTNCKSFDYLSNAKILGNYIHDFGCTGTSGLQHTMYLSIRSDDVDLPVNIDAVEIAYNYLEDNESRNGIHFYDETFGTAGCGQFSGTTTIHSNYITGQRSAGIFVGSRSADGSTCWDCDFDIYNNVIIDSGLAPRFDIANNESFGVELKDRGFGGTVQVYNNSIYNTGVNPSESPAAASSNIGIQASSNAGNLNVVISNNIAYDTVGGPYSDIDGAINSLSGSNNLWFSTGGTLDTDIISQLTSNTFDNPDFTSVTNLSLLSTSPAIDAGVVGLYTTDFLQVERPQGAAFDVGAYEFADLFGLTRSAGLPTGEQPSGTTQVTMSLTTDVNATCKYGADGATGVDYDTLANTLDGSGTTSHTVTISGLTDGNSYSRAVRCQKTSDSEQNDTDYVISWSVASGTPVTTRQAFSGSGSFSLLQ